MRLKDLATARVRYGYDRLHILLRREGWRVNRKRIYRLYKEEGLSIRAKTPRRRRSCRYRGDRTATGAVNEVWAMDFMADALFEGRPFRLLTIVDCRSRESLAIHAKPALRAGDVIEVLDRIVRERGAPKALGRTMGRNSPGGCSINGRISTASRSTSQGLTPRWGPVTIASRTTPSGERQGCFALDKLGSATKH